MALSKLLISSLLLSLLLLNHLVDAQQAVQESVAETTGSVLQQIGKYMYIILRL